MGTVNGEESGDSDPVRARGEIYIQPTIFRGDFFPKNVGNVVFLVGF